MEIMNKKIATDSLIPQQQESFTAFREDREFMGKLLIVLLR